MKPVFNDQQVVTTARNSLAARAVLKLGTICDCVTELLQNAFYFKGGEDN
jgi:hypothetical protein